MSGPWPPGVAAVLVVLAAALAGCTGDDAPSDGDGFPTATPSTTPGEATPTSAPATPTPSTPGSPGPTIVPQPDDDEITYLWDQSDLRYTNAVKRWAITSPTEANYTFAWTGRIASVYWEPSCLVGSIHGDGRFAALAFWPGAAELNPKVRIAGSNEEIAVYPTQNTATTPWLEFEGSGNGTLTPGDRLVIELGGSTDAVFTWSNASNETAESEVRLAIVGDHQIDPLPDAPLACGSGAETAEGSTVGATFYVLEAEIGGTVAMTTQEASTMMLATGTDILGANEFSYDFLGETATFTAPMNVDRSSPEGGLVQATFHQELSVAQRGLSWLFVDSDWELS